MTGAWDKWANLLDPKKFEARMRSNMRRATLRNALLVKAEIRKRIKEGRYEENSLLTLAGKAPSTKPLVHHGDLFGAVTHVLIDDFSAFVGIRRSAKGKEGQELVNIAAVLHEGAVLKVTAAMRAAVMAKINENTKGAKKLAADPPQGPAKSTWVIPSRPFVRQVVEDPIVRRRLMANWNTAVEGALFGRK